MKGERGLHILTIYLLLMVIQARVRFDGRVKGGYDLSSLLHAHTGTPQEALGSFGNSGTVQNDGVLGTACAETC